jgi:hypothetical protein
VLGIIGGPFQLRLAEATLTVRMAGGDSLGYRLAGTP